MNYNAYERQSVTTIRQMQVAYLYWEKNETYTRISEITGYAVSTCRTYARTHNNYPCGMFDDVQMIVPERVTHRTCGAVTVPMNYLPNCGDDVKGQQTAYLFKFYTNNRAVPVFSKIGTTATSVNNRLRQEIGEYRKKGFDIRSVDVCKIYDCGCVPAEAYESYLRALLIAEFPNTWHRNDRFFGVDIPTDRFCELCDQFAKCL